MRELSRRTAGVVGEVVQSGRPVLVTRHGHPVAALIPLRDEELEDWILANAPEFVEDMKRADEEIARGETVPWEQVQRQLETEGFYR